MSVRKKIWFLTAGVLLLLQAILGAAPAGHLRPAQFAGGFYPAGPKELSSLLDRFLAQAPALEAGRGRIAAIMVPHAGYIYSGETAARVYKNLEGKVFDTVILLGPSHHIPFSGAAVWGEGAWETPLGAVSVDEQLARLIAAGDDHIRFSEQPHLGEHSLEVQLPFLQKTLGSFQIVPIVLNDASQENCTRLAAALASALKETSKRVLLVASTDLSHYHDSARALEMDEKALAAIEREDTLGLARLLSSGEAELCGDAAVLTLLETIRRLPQTPKAVKLERGSSAKASGDEKRVVGYGAVLFVGEAKEETADQPKFDGNRRAKLLGAAKQSIENALAGRDLDPGLSGDSVLDAPSPAFVTVFVKGELRGCIGTIGSGEPLYKVVQEKARDAAFHDSRFSPVTAGELKDLKIEISILENPQRMNSPEQLVLGRHGIMVFSPSGRSGLFLPEVSVEQKWTREEFLDAVCTEKAGLPPGCWKDPSNQAFIFQTEAFTG